MTELGEPGDSNPSIDPAVIGTYRDFLDLSQPFYSFDETFCEQYGESEEVLFQPESKRRNFVFRKISKLSPMSRLDFADEFFGIIALEWNETPDGDKLPAFVGPVQYAPPQQNYPANFGRELRQLLLNDYDHDDEYGQDEYEYFGDGYSSPTAYESDDDRYTVSKHTHQCFSALLHKAVQAPGHNHHPSPLHRHTCRPHHRTCQPHHRTCRHNRPRRHHCSR